MAIGYASVKVNITSFVVDGIDSDDLPDDAPLTAKLMLTPMIQPGRTLQFNDAGQMKLKAVAPISVDIGATGDINHQGRDFVKVVAPTAAETNLARLQWRADFSDIRLGGALAAVKIDPIYFWVDPGVDINIADHVNVAASTAVSISRGARGFGIVGFETVDGDLVPLYESADGVIAGEPVSLAGVVSDAVLAGVVADDESATRAVLDGVVAPKLDKTEAAETYAPIDAVNGKLDIAEAEETYTPVATLPPYVYQEARFAIADDTGITSGPDWGRLIARGSSLANGMLSRLTTFAASKGATVVDQSGSGQSGEHIFARSGSRPLKTGGFLTIPASGSVIVSSSNVSSLSYATVNYHGHFDGHPERPGTMSKVNTPQPGYTFTPDAPGTAFSVPVGTKFIPTLEMYRTAPMFSNTCKNNVTGVPGGTGDVDKCIQWTIDDVNHSLAKGHPIMVLGHYADVGAAPDVVAKIKKYNDGIKAALGWRYLDLYSVFSPEGSLLPEYAAGDGIHLNTTGNNVLMAMVEAAATRMGWFPGGLNLASSLVASFRGDDIAGADGDTVSSWASRGGSAGALAFSPQTNGPELNVGGFQGHKTVIFDAANSEGLTTAVDSVALTAATYVLICRVLSTTGTGQNLLSGHSTTYQRIYTSTGATVINASGLSGNELNTGIYGALGDWLIIVARFNGSDGSLSTNGTTAVGQLTASAQSRLRLGVNAGGTSGRANAEFAALDVYSKALNEDEVAAAVDAMVATLTA